MNWTPQKWICKWKILSLQNYRENRRIDPKYALLSFCFTFSFPFCSTLGHSLHKSSNHISFMARHRALNNRYPILRVILMSPLSMDDHIWRCMKGPQLALGGGPGPPHPDRSCGWRSPELIRDIPHTSSSSSKHPRQGRIINCLASRLSRRLQLGRSKLNPLLQRRLHTHPARFPSPHELQLLPLTEDAVRKRGTGEIHQISHAGGHVAESGRGTDQGKIVRVCSSQVFVVFCLGVAYPIQPSTCYE